MAELTTIFWRDIPAQVIGQKGRTRYKQVLNQRFAVAIDRAAMRAGRGSSDKYLEDWRRKSQPLEGNMEEIVAEHVKALEEAFPEVLLEKIVKAGGKKNPGNSRHD